MVNHIYDIQTSNIQTSKIINSTCICEKGLPWIRDKVLMLDPCEHLIHQKCFNKKKTNKCPFCDILIIRIIHANDFKKDPSLYQKCIDIISMTNYDGMTRICTEQAIFNIPNLLGLIVQLPFTKGCKEG